MSERQISRRRFLRFWERDTQPPGPVHLRPPGAIDEATFVDQCIRCGECIAVCPADAIAAVDTPGAAFGTPVIHPRQAACVLCNGLQCTQVCPTHSLVQLRFHHEIRMGTAVVDHDTCKLATGERCTTCITTCPVPNALVLSDNAILVDARVCVGCGLCEQDCPTEPTSIRVEPRRR